MAARQGDTGRMWEGNTRGWAERRAGGGNDRVRPGPETRGQSSGVPDCRLGGGAARCPRSLRQAP